MSTGKKSVDEIILSLPRHEHIIVKRLRNLILEVLPKAIEKNSYGVPFYSRNRMICFIWPPSIYWGPKKSEYGNKGVTLGFCQGNLFSNDDGVLLSEGRKKVYCMYFNSVKDIDENQLRALLYEAEMIDEQFKSKKSKKKD